MWTCEKCKEEIEDNFDSCWNCIKESDVKEEMDRINSEKPDINTLIKEESKKAKTKYRRWQNVCFVILSGLISYEFLSRDSLAGGGYGFLVLYTILIIIVLMFGKK